MNTKEPTDNKEPKEPEKLNSNGSYLYKNDIKDQPFLNKSQGLAILAIIIVIILFVASATSLAFIYIINNKDREKKSSSNLSTNFSASTFPVTAVAASGYLEPKGEVIRVSAPAFAEGTRVNQLLIKQGDTVKAGQILAILDSRERLESAVELAQTQVKVAQSQLDQVKAGPKQGSINAQQAKIDTLKAELKGQIVAQKATIASLQDRLKGQTKEQEATIERLKAELKNANKECERYQSLYKDGAVSASIYDSKCLEEKIIREQQKEGESALFRIVNTLKKDIQEAQANLTRTIITLEKQIIEAEATKEEIAEVRPVDVLVAQSKLEEAIATVGQAKANLNLAYVRVPRSGKILKIHTFPGELVSNQGIVDLGQTNQMNAVAEVYQTDINKIRLGQRATVTSDGFNGKLQGTVDDVGLQIGKKDVLGTDPTANTDARVVEVKIRLDPKDSQKVKGLTNLEVNVIIDTSQFLE